MQNTDFPPTSINSSTKMHQAPWIICHQYRCSGTLSIIQFIVHDAFRHITMLDRSCASESTTHIRLWHLTQLQPQRVLDDMSRLCTQPKTIDRLARIMIRHDDMFTFALPNWQFCTICQQNMIHKARKIHHFLGQCLCSSLPSLLLQVLEKPGIVLCQRYYTTRCSAYDVVGVAFC